MKKLIQSINPSNDIDIHFIITGGTIDKIYDAVSGNLSFTESNVCKAIKSSRCELNITIEKLMLIDSLNINHDDRQSILKKVMSCNADKIIITHGTDTMTDSAQLIGNNCKDKTIVITGAMIPFQFNNSDALFNLGTAIAFVQSKPKGVYIAMNGKCFNYYNVKKDLKHGIFSIVNNFNIDKVNYFTKFDNS